MRERGGRKGERGREGEIWRKVGRKSREEGSVGREVERKGRNGREGGS